MRAIWAGAKEFVLTASVMLGVVGAIGLATGTVVFLASKGYGPQVVAALVLGVILAPAASMAKDAYKKAKGGEE